MKNVIREDDYLSIEYVTHIGGHLVTLFGECEYNESMEVVFTIDKTTTRHETKYKIAISKWLLKCWKDMLTEYDSFYCMPQDGCNDWRFHLYKKLGFRYVGSDIMVKGQYR